MRTIRVHEDDKPFWLEIVEYFLGVIAIAGAVYFCSQIALRVIVDKVPEKFENVMVHVIDYEEFSTPFFYLKTEVMVQQLADQMEQSLPNAPKLTIRIIEEERPTLLCLPGGYIILSSGLLKQLTSENELTFLLAHAIGHIYSRHHLLALSRGATWVYFSGLIFGPEHKITETLAGHFSFTHSKYTSNQEEEADKTAVKLVKIKYNHAGGIIELLNRLKNNSSNTSSRAFLTEHPLTTERMDALKNMFGIGSKKVPPVPLDLSFLNKRSF